MTIFEVLFIPTIIAAVILGPMSVKYKWKVPDFF